MNPKVKRCAIYTRKSSEEGLDQDFNSLDAQREAGESYVKSQKHEGWEVITTKYDDGGYSGGNIERPALKTLLSDISAGKIDTVVVYKVDRLTRALSDFAKIIEIFDKQNVSFVSVTQQFNTTTSMGRLTLNVLLSFAQFEREVTGERIRDKVNASKKKGIWMGGNLPLGYKLVDKKLIIEPKEAEIIRYIFNQYLAKTQSWFTFLEDLKDKGYKNKSWVSKTGNTITGKEFHRKSLPYILTNPIYAGKIKHQGKVYEGEHKAIISQDVWDKVQAKIALAESGQMNKSYNDRPKLVGKIFDYHGNRLSPTYSYKYSENGRYKMRYYINRELNDIGKTSSEFKRIRADYLDKAVEDEISKIIENRISEITASKNSELISANLKNLEDIRNQPVSCLSKAVLFPDHIELHLNLDGVHQIINIPAQYKRYGGKLFIAAGESTEVNKEYCHPEDKTFIFIAKAFYWSKLIKDGTYKTCDQISKAQGHSHPYVKRALRQRYLSPKIIEQIVSPANDKQIDIERLTELNHWCWTEQERIIKVNNKNN